MLRARGRGGVCLKSSGALEVYCRRVDVEMLRYGALEARCRRVASKRYGALEAGCSSFVLMLRCCLALVDTCGLKLLSVCFGSINHCAVLALVG